MSVTLDLVLQGLNLDYEDGSVEEPMNAMCCYRERTMCSLLCLICTNTNLLENSNLFYGHQMNEPHIPVKELLAEALLRMIAAT